MKEDTNISRRDLLKKAGKVGAGATLLGSQTIGQANASNLTSDTLKSESNGYCFEDGNSWGRDFAEKAHVSNTVEYLGKQESEFNSNQYLYRYRFSTSVAQTTFEQRNITNPPKFDFWDYCETEIGPMTEEDDRLGFNAPEEITIQVILQNSSSDVGLYVPDGSVGLGATPANYWSLDLAQDDEFVDNFKPVIETGISTLPLAGGFYSLTSLLNKVGQDEYSSGLGDNRAEFSFTSPDGAYLRDNNTVSAFVEIMVRAPKDGPEPEFSMISKVDNYSGNDDMKLAHDVRHWSFGVGSGISLVNEYFNHL